jgi:hypothetical protein
MSKGTAVAIILIETAKQSFELTGEQCLLPVVLKDVCLDESVQKHIKHNISGGIFSKKPTPSNDDYLALYEELKPQLKRFENNRVLQAICKAIECDRLLGFEGDDVVLDTVEDFGIGKIEAEYDDGEL